MPVTIEAPAIPETTPRARTARVAVVRTTPSTVLEDYARVMDLAGYREILTRDRDTLIKLNLSWTKYFPACSSQPWQVDGVIGKMLDDGFSRRHLIPIENKTVVTSPREGCRNNRWESVLDRHGLTFTPLPRGRVAGLSIQESAAETECDFPRGHSDSGDLPGWADPAFADRQDPRPRRDDRIGQELVRRAAA